MYPPVPKDAHGVTLEQRIVKVHFLGQGGIDLLCCFVRDPNEQPNQAEQMKNIFRELNELDIGAPELWPMMMFLGYISTAVAKL